MSLTKDPLIVVNPVLITSPYTFCLQTDLV